MDAPMAAGGVYSTAHDTAIFAQMFLNSGIYDNARILSRATVAEMTRNQIPGIGTHWRGESHDEALWGYGWNIYSGDDWKYSPGTLMSPEAYRHEGAGGVYLWVDPVHELVGVYFSVVLEMIDDIHQKDSAELFANAVTAAIDD